MVIASANIIPLEKYVIDTGAYVLYDPSIVRNGPTYENELSNNMTYWDSIAYPESAPTLAIAVSERDEEVTFDELDSRNPDAIKVETPYPGRIVVQNGTVMYVGKIGHNASLMISTSDINSASFLIKNISVYPKSQENTLIASTVAKGLT